MSAVSVPVRDAQRRSVAPIRDGALLSLVGILLALAALLARFAPWTSGSDFGYGLGVAGGVALGGLFLYPLRKRWRRAQNWGASRGWFAAHMALGLAAPLLVVLHSRLEFGSLNATIAFACMVLVAASGVVGRFLYSRIHVGLYGERENVVALKEELDRRLAALREVGLAPAIERQLEAYAGRADAAAMAGLSRPWRYPLLALDAVRTARNTSAMVKGALAAQAREEGRDRAELSRRLRRRRVLLHAYVRTVLRAAQLSVHQRLFSWWHVLHVPLVWMLVVTTIAHVVAVHMY